MMELAVVGSNRANVPRVSVIMPVFNAGPFLRQAIISILEQTEKNFELIVINDGSLDDSEKIIKSIKDPRIRYFYQQNAGVAATLNRGVGLATGAYIWRHDADDISLPGKLQAQLGFLEANPDIALCATQVAFMTERGKVAWKFRQPKSIFFGNNEFVYVEREHFNPYSPITHGTVLVRTQSMREIGGYRKCFVTGEDIDLWLRLLEKNKLAVINQCLSLHRLSKASATQRHGWKNEFYRNKAFEYYDQRKASGQDDLQRMGSITVPALTEGGISFAPGKRFRGDLLDFLYPLHLNAGDWKGAIEIVRYSVGGGYRLGRTWKAIFIPLLPKALFRWRAGFRNFFSLSKLIC